MIIRNRKMDCLFNPTEDQRIEREPLLKYSFYLSSKNNLLLNVIDEIIEKLDEGFSEKMINADLVGDGSVLTWFWTLGAYEIVRTMSQTKDCFSETINKKIEELKIELAGARMPSSKMEKRGHKLPVNSDRDFDRLNVKEKDLLIGDPDSPISARMLFNLYESTMSAIRPIDVIKRHELSTQYSKA